MDDSIVAIFRKHWKCFWIIYDDNIECYSCKLMLASSNTFRRDNSLIMIQEWFIVFPVPRFDVCTELHVWSKCPHFLMKWKWPKPVFTVSQFQGQQKFFAIGREDHGLYNHLLLVTHIYSKRQTLHWSVQENVTTRKCNLHAWKLKISPFGRFVLARCCFLFHRVRICGHKLDLDP